MGYEWDRYQSPTSFAGWCRKYPTYTVLIYTCQESEIPYSFFFLAPFLTYTIVHVYIAKHTLHFVCILQSKQK